MNYNVKVMIVKRGYDKDLEELFLANPQAGKCPVFQDGKEFFVTEENHNNFPYEHYFCIAAWDVIKIKVYAALQGCDICIGKAVLDRLHRYFMPC